MPKNVTFTFKFDGYVSVGLCREDGLNIPENDLSILLRKLEIPEAKDVTCIPMHSDGFYDEGIKKIPWIKKGPIGDNSKWYFGHLTETRIAMLETYVQRYNRC